MSPKEKRKALFNLYARSISLYFPDLKGIFLCPICCRQFHVESLKDPDPQVTLAHVFPESAGGRKTTLACKTCNSTIGHSYERELAAEKRLSDWWIGKRPLAVRFQNAKSSAALELRFSKNQASLEVKLREKATNPAAWKAIHNEPPTQADPLRARLPTPETELFQIALIHSAFMLMFYELGYEYVLSENVDPVRKLLLGAGSVHEFENVIAPLPASIRDPKFVGYTINVVIEPKDCACFLVGLPVPVLPGSSFTRCVLFPGFWESGKIAYQRLRSSARPFMIFKAVTMKFCCPREKRLVDGKHMHIARSFWDRHLKQGRWTAR
jgi:HNH endonuclease